MKNKHIIVLFILGFILIILGFISNFFINFKEDKQITNLRMEDVNRLYEPFLSDINNFNETRDDLYINVFSEIYYDNLKENIKDLHLKLTEYETLVDHITQEAKKLKEYCNNYYSDASVNTKCSNYKENYEKTVNCFVGDIEKVNKVIKDYNNYQKENNINVEGINLYRTDKKYIDYNGDKKYSGKDEG